MENTISADDKKPILNSKEKRRFSQISEQFFKGSHEFFVEQQLKTQKFINEKLKKSSFYEHYQDSIQNIKNEMRDKIDVMKNNIKKTLGKKIMDFIIFLEIGIIAASQSPFRIESAVKTIDELRLSFPIIYIETKDSFDSIVHFLNGLGFQLDAKELFKKITGGIFNTAVDMVVLFANALDFFFNNVDNNAFLICLGECAMKVGESASGAVGIILDLLLSAANKSIAKRPDLRHFLTYGINPYLLASQIEMESYSLIGRHSEVHLSSLQFGVFRGIWYGAVNENGQVIDWQNFLTLGLHRGDDEEDDIKKDISNLVNLRIAASRASSRSFSGNYLGANTVFDTDAYKRLIASWTSERARTHEYDLQMNQTATLHQIQLNNYYASTETVNQHRDTIRNFYKSYNDSNNPIASRICREIRERLMVRVKRNGKFVDEIMGERTNGYMHSNVFVFAPLILYAIIEFQHIQKLSSQMNLQLDMQLYAQEVESLNNIESQALSIIKHKIELFNQGIIDAKTLLTDLIENLNTATTRKENWFKPLKMLRPDIIFTSFKYLPHLINSIVKPFNNLQIINALSFWLSDDEFLIFLNGNSTMYHVTTTSFASSHAYEGKSSQASINNYSWANRSIVEQSELGYDSVEEGNMFMWRSIEQTLGTISTRHVEKKKEIITLFERRKAIWGIISSIVDGLDKEKLYPELHYINGVLQRSVNTNNG